MSNNFLNLDEPNFIWKGLNALKDMDCVIEGELPEILPQKRYETYSIIGRNGELHETFNDYESFDYDINNVTVPSNRLRDVKKWLTGRDRLITHNDLDKYYDAIASFNKQTSFTNEWGLFYTFNISFRCQPLKKKVHERAKKIDKKVLTFHDPGDEPAKPYIEIDSNGGEITLSIGNEKLTILKTQSGIVSIDCEVGKVIQEGLPLFTKGEWLITQPGKNKLSIDGDFNSGKLWNRSLFV